MTARRSNVGVEDSDNITGDLRKWTEEWDSVTDSVVWHRLLTLRNTFFVIDITDDVLFNLLVFFFYFDLYLCYVCMFFFSFVQVPLIYLFGLEWGSSAS